MLGQPRKVAADADRERLVAVLREHYALGNIDDAELDRRIGIALSAQFTDEAAVALAELPLLTSQGSVKSDRRRHAQTSRPGPGWVPTSERFRDPTSKVIMRVWIDPADDSRHYVPEPPA